MKIMFIAFQTKKKYIILLNESFLTKVVGTRFPTDILDVTHIAHGSPTDVRQMSYWDIQNIRLMSEGPPHIRTGGRSEVGITLEDLPKSAPTDIRRSSNGT